VVRVPHVPVPVPLPFQPLVFTQSSAFNFQSTSSKSIAGQQSIWRKKSPMYRESQSSTESSHEQIALTSIMLCTDFSNSSAYICRLGNFYKANCWRLNRAKGWFHPVHEINMKTLQSLYDGKRTNETTSESLVAKVLQMFSFAFSSYDLHFPFCKCDCSYIKISQMRMAVAKSKEWKKQSEILKN
jgi:hypothetical protein